MDDFRAILKTFQMLDDPVSSETSRDACLNLARATIDVNLRRKIREFVDDHLLPARSENAGKELGRRQNRLQQSLERILAKTSRHESGDDAATIPINPRLSDGTARWSEPVTSSFEVAPALLSTPTAISNSGGNTSFYHFRASSTPANAYPSPASGPGTSQLQQVYTWGGKDAVRGLFDLDKAEPTDKRGQKLQQNQSAEEVACKELGERYGSVWKAPGWAGKGAPIKEYGDAGKQ